jgi:hypothetical protein
VSKFWRLAAVEYQKSENNKVPTKERFIIVNSAKMYFVKLKTYWSKGVQIP